MLVVMAHDYDSSWPYQPYRPCPCGSREKAKFCCRAGKNKWITRPQWRPSGDNVDVTGYDHLKCFAAGTRCCGQKLTAEHYISESVLRVFLGDKAAVSGFVFPDKTVGISALTAKILCDRHNSLLAPLDTAAARLTRNVVDFVRVAAQPDALERGFFLLNGDDIESWLLKMLCGLVASGAVPSLAKGNPPGAWLDALYGRAPWPSDWGLYVRNEAAGVESTIVEELKIGFRDDSEQQPYRLALAMGPWHLVLHVGADADERPAAGFTHRPTLLLTQHGETSLGIGLTYSRPSEGEFVRTTVHSFRVTSE